MSNFSSDEVKYARLSWNFSNIVRSALNFKCPKLWFSCCYCAGCQQKQPKERKNKFTTFHDFVMLVIQVWSLRKIGVSKLWVQQSSSTFGLQVSCSSEHITGSIKNWGLDLQDFVLHSLSNMIDGMKVNFHQPLQDLCVT